METNDMDDEERLTTAEAAQRFMNEHRELAGNPWFEAGRISARLEALREAGIDGFDLTFDEVRAYFGAETKEAVAEALIAIGRRMERDENASG